MTGHPRNTLRLAAGMAAALALAGCATPPAPQAPPAPIASAPVAPPPPAAPAPVAAPQPTPAPAPVAPAAILKLETILQRLSGDSGVQISTTPTGALRVRATGDAAFDTGSATISPRFGEFLQTLANGLQTFGTLSAKVSGHTDSTGDAQLNDRLSEARATATVNRLVSLGVPAARLLAEGRGQKEPIASNDSAEGRAANRRVDLLIIELPQ
jgi:outer membrane protein OmpA-like peptidoglycan-associated protein